MEFQGGVGSIYLTECPCLADDPNVEICELGRLPIVTFEDLKLTISADTKYKKVGNSLYNSMAFDTDGSIKIEGAVATWNKYYLKYVLGMEELTSADIVYPRTAGLEEMEQLHIFRNTYAVPVAMAWTVNTGGYFDSTFLPAGDTVTNFQVQDSGYNAGAAFWRLGALLTVGSMVDYYQAVVIPALGIAGTWAGDSEQTRWDNLVAYAVMQTGTDDIVLSWWNKDDASTDNFINGSVYVSDENGDVLTPSCETGPGFIAAADSTKFLETLSAGHPDSEYSILMFWLPITFTSAIYYTTYKFLTDAFSHAAYALMSESKKSCWQMSIYFPYLTECAQEAQYWYFYKVHVNRAFELASKRDFSNTTFTAEALDPLLPHKRVALMWYD
jgi:hypothetical protein